MNTESDREIKYKALRDEMVDVQLIGRGIRDGRLIKVMREVPRHEFAPSEVSDLAYDDCALPIGEGQTISQPYMVAIMTELLSLKGHEKVLEVGSGSGYQAAILGRLSMRVFSVERIGSLALHAAQKLGSLGFNNVTVSVGDGSEGLSSESPFDAIIVTAACPDIPVKLVDQLSNGGRIVLPVGDRFVQTLTLGIKRGNGLEVEESIGCVFVPLLGRYGFQSE